MNPASKPRWQQAAALVSLGAGGAVTGFSFIPGTVADPAAPPITQIRLLALRQAAQAQPSANKNGMLRSAIVNVAQYYLRLAATKTPAEMEALIWQRDSPDGVDHGQSCAAFASLTLELAAQVVGQQSWVTGGSSYPWPLHDWADVRVDPNPDSLQIISVLQDAQAQHRWRPIGDGYQPQPGDWVMFDGHVEVVTSYANGVLDTIGGDSLPDFSVNAHQYSGPLAGQGVTGFVNNGDLAEAAARPGAAVAGAAGTGGAAGAAGGTAAVGAVAGPAARSEPVIPGAPAGGSAGPAAPAPAGARPSPRPTSGSQAGPGPAGSAAEPSRASSTPAGAGRPSGSRTVADAAVPGTGAPIVAGAAAPAAARTKPGSGIAIPGLAAADASSKAQPPASPKARASGGTAAPTAPAAAAPTAPDKAARPAASAGPYARHQPAAATAAAPGSSQQAFISAVTAGAIAAQRRYGVPAAVTIAQAIDESAWGQSALASRDHNLFGIKGIGPAGSDRLPTQEYVNGQTVTVTSSFRVYRSDAESIDDHGRLLATSGYYRQAMSYRQNPNAFASALTGVYATDPHYGAKIISLMSEYDLYQYDNAASAPAAQPAASPSGSAASAGSSIPGVPPASTSAAPSPSRPASPPAAPPPATSPPTSTPAPTPSSPMPSAPAPPTATPSAPAPGRTPAPSRATSPVATRSPRSPASALSATAAVPGVPAAPAGRARAGAATPAEGATRPGSPRVSTAQAGDTDPGAAATPAPAGTGTRAAAGAGSPSDADASPATAAVPGAPSPQGGSAAPARAMEADIPATTTTPAAGHTAAAVSPAASSPARAAGSAASAARRRPGLLADLARPFARATPPGAAPARKTAAQAATARAVGTQRAPTGRAPAAARQARLLAAQRPAAQPPAGQRPAAQPPAGRRAASQPAPAQPAASRRPAAQPPAAQRPSALTVSTRTPRPVHPAAAASGRTRRAAGSGASGRPTRYRHQMPASVTSAFLTSAQLPLLREEPLYRDVAGQTGIRWELLAACDWMQCRARPRFSPVHGEKLGATNSDGTVYRTRSEALEQCAEDLADLAWAVYRIDIGAPGALSVRDLANAYAAFRWGGLLKLHRTSAMEFPYSVAGLTSHLVNMRWPNIAEPNAPDRPGTRFRMPFGAVPVVLSLDYPAIA